MTLAIEMDKQRREGIAEGMAKGMAEGEAKGKAEAVVGMLQEKLSVDMIARITKLTVEQITEIGKKNALI